MVSAQAVDQPLPPDLTARADELEYLSDEKLVIYRKGVTIDYQEVFISADVVQLNVETLDIEAFGAVRLERGRTFIEGEHLTGNLRSKIFQFDRFDGQFNLWEFKAEHAVRQADGSFVIQQASLTTCDDWWLKASEVTHHPNGDFTAKHVRWTAFGLPLLYLPYLSGNSEELNSSYHFSAGHRSNWGYYLSIGRDWRLGDIGKTTLWGDYRTERGFALGNEGELENSKLYTDWHLYGMHDEDPPADLHLGGRDFSNRFETEDDRYRLQLFSRYRFTPNVSVMGNIDYISDNDFLLEFYRSTYNTYREPPTFLNLTLGGERYDFNILYSQRVNDFYTSVEKLPEIRLDMPRQELINSGLYYQSGTSWAVLRTNWREYDVPRLDGAEADDYSTWRFDTLHFLYYPLQLGWLNIVPRAGFRYTYYDDTSSTRVSQQQLNLNASADSDRARRTDRVPITNYSGDGGDDGRTLFEFGLESSFKASHTWYDLQNDALGLDGLRHIVQPYINYTYITNPDEGKDNLYWFDEVDRIDDVNVVRIGMKQRMQTRRQKQLYTFVRADTFVDYYVKPEDNEPEAGELGQAIEFLPTRNVTVDAKVLVDYDNWNTNVVDAGVRLGDIEKLAVRVGYLYRDNYQSRYNYSMGSDQTVIGPVVTNPTMFDQNHNIRVTFDWQITPKTHLQTEHYFDLDRGELTTQSYQISQDFRCWITSLKVEENGENVTVMVVLTMKGVGYLRTGG